MNFNKSDIQQGRLNAQASEETPGTFGEINGADQASSSRDLARSPQRMAGQKGARAMALLTDPEEQQRTHQWMQQFGMSNQGMEWNQAKMMGGMPQPQQPQ